MSLSCYCESDGDFEWYYLPPNDFSTLETKRSRKCSSCKQKIKVGETVAKFRRFRSPVNDIEERIYGEDVKLAPYYMCETCGGLFFAIQEMDMCCDIEKNIKEQIAEYREITRMNEAHNDKDKRREP